MAYENPFYSPLSDTVQKELENRNKIYSTDDRNSVGYDNYRKTAYAIIKGYNPASKKDKTLNQLSHVEKENGFDQWYNKNDRYSPDPYLSSVEISNQGRYGSLRKVSFEIKVFTLNQLDEIEHIFMIPGNDIHINYGWTAADSTQDAMRGSFVGLVYNFSWNMRDDGGFDCSVEAVGKGFFALGAEVTSQISGNKQKIEGESEDPKESNSFITYLDNIKEGIELKHKDSPAYNSESGVLKSYVDSGDNKTPNWYISIEGITKLINKLIIGQTSQTKDAPRYVTDIKGDSTAVSYYDPIIKSGNPYEMIMPDTKCSFYGKDTKGKDVQFATDIPKIKYKLNEKDADLSKIMCEFKAIEDHIQSAEKDGAVSVPDFYKKIFDAVAKNSGGIYKLSLISTNDPNIIQIVDTNYTGVKKLTPYSILIHNKKSPVKSMNLSSSIPSKMATALYIGGSTGRSTEINPRVAKMITGKDYEKVSTKEAEKAGEDYVTKVLDLNNTQGAWNPIEQKQMHINTHTYKSYTKLGEAKRKIKKYAGLIAREQLSEEDNDLSDHVSNLRSALEEYKLIQTKGGWNHRILYPLNLSFTLEGLNGFRFGNVITTNWLPEKYKDSDFSFVITNIVERISDGMWETEIETQCRLG